MKVTKNIELWNTPGHTNQDISVVVRNVPCCGTVGVVGDLFYTESDAAGNTTDQWTNDAWNPTLGMNYRAKMICEVNWIIPGHGKMFKVTDTMKRRYNCSETTETVSTAATTVPTTPTTIFSTTIIPPTFPNTPINTPVSTPADFPTPPPFADPENSQEDHQQDDLIVTATTQPTPTPNPQTYVTVDHWQNKQKVGSSEEPEVPVAKGPVANGLYAVQAGLPIAQVPLAGHLAYFAAPPPAVTAIQEPQTGVIHHLPVYPVRPAPIHPPGGLFYLVNSKLWLKLFL